ncbi:hypothetical protein PR003_g28578 [Phytophthora rubi]|uniref:DDE Tnp4 domain-containing protein n=2 Tax=Phytophthora rubi TaxID=129364 RepID=A0A6A4BT74_9STRA|nr:hypothetical protein PR001_g27282 [Phytophthora rubi]KAE9278252.1 hypothetical protein PR003_g28578 [Phytophthora rubi]
MPDARVVVVLSGMSRARVRAHRSLKGLQRRLKEELMRVEHARLVRIRHYITASCLPRPDVAPWMYMWFFGTDENFLNVTSLCRRSFNRLLERFKLFYNIPRFSPKGGRPKKLQEHHQVLGLLMAFYVDSMQHKSLCSTIGLPHSTLSRVLADAEVAMKETLAGFSPARIVWPTIARQKALSRLTAARSALLPFTWGFIDGKNYRVQEPSHPDFQNAHYNGWLHCVYVTETLCFGADGLIVWCKHNCPGSWNDSDTSLEFREKLTDPSLNPDPRYGVIADSAFPCGEDMVGRIMTPLKDGDLGRLVPSVRAVAQLKSTAITFVRQTAEWGMGSVEKVYRRLLHPLPYDKEKRKLRLNNLFRLANYRVRTVEISPIRTVFVHGREDNK